MSAEAYGGAGWTGKVMQALNVVWTLVLVNLLFAAGTLVGLVIGGIMPAAVATASVLLPGRDGENRAGDDGVVRTFVREYRAAFRRANLAGIPFLLTAVLLVADASVLPALDGPVAALLGGLTAVIGLVVLVAWAVAVTLLVRYDDGPAALVRYAFAVTLSAPITGLGVLVAFIAFGIISAVFPVVIPLIGVSLPLAIAVRLVDRRLARLDPSAA